jgi:hypothetical protein
MVQKKEKQYLANMVQKQLVKGPVQIILLHFLLKVETLKFFNNNCKRDRQKGENCLNFFQVRLLLD